MTAATVGAKVAFGEAVFIGRFRSRSQEKNCSPVPSSPEDSVSPKSPCRPANGDCAGRTIWLYFRLSERPEITWDRKTCLRLSPRASPRHQCHG